jgi:hypothetical protein
MMSCKMLVSSAAWRGCCPPVYVQVPVDPDIQAPDLLALLFKRGAALLLDHLPCVWAGTAAPVAQEEAGATHAPKVGGLCGLTD